MSLMMRKFYLVVMALLMQIQYSVFGLQTVSIDHQNSKSADVFVLVDEGSIPNYLEHLLMLGYLADTTEKLGVTGLPIRYSFGFYGATNETQWISPSSTSGTFLIRSALYSYPFTGKRTFNMLPIALKNFEERCTNSCRNSVPRILVIMGFSSGEQDDLDTIRRLERDLSLTVIAFQFRSSGYSYRFPQIGSQFFNESNFEFESISQLVNSPVDITGLAGKLPITIEYNTNLTLTNFTLSDFVYFQLNLKNFTEDKDGLFSFTLRCRDCLVYVSRTQSKSMWNDVQPLPGTNVMYGIGGGKLYYARIPQGVRRVYLTIKTNDPNNIINGISNVVPYDLNIIN